MSDILSTLGITTAAPDPTKYTNQQAVDAQMKSIKGQITSLQSQLNTAVTVGTLFGVPDTYTKQLTDLTAQAEALKGMNLAPDVLDAKRKELEAKFTETKDQQLQRINKQMIESAQEAVDVTATRLKEVETEGVASPELLEKYRKLRERALQILQGAQAAILSASSGTAATAAAAAEGFQDAAAAAAAAAPFDPSTMKQPQEILDSLESLDLEYAAEKDKKSGESNVMILTAKTYAVQTALIVVVVGSILFGGIIAVNSYIKEPFLPIRLFYFIYGAALFPLALLGGAVKPPAWKATIFPLGTPAAQTAATETLWKRILQAISILLLAGWGGIWWISGTNTTVKKWVNYIRKAQPQVAET